MKRLITSYGQQPILYNVFSSLTSVGRSSGVQAKVGFHRFAGSKEWRRPATTIARGKPASLGQRFKDLYNGSFITLEASIIH